MLTKVNFEKYQPIVMDAMDELFQHCINKSIRENEFLLFLEQGHYDKTFNNPGFSPYLMGQGMAGVIDNDRLAFVELFIKLPYEKKLKETNHPQEIFELRRESTALSMMVYTHFWESKFFLRKLRHLAILAQGKPYEWDLLVNPKNTYNFIKNEIREIFNIEKLKLYGIIKQTYRSQLRNAFAHSDYYISGSKIFLNNYDPADLHTVESIEFEEYDILITMTLLIHHCMVSKADEFRNKLGDENPDRDIFVPEKGGVIKSLHYRKAGEDQDGNDFYRWLWPNQLDPNDPFYK